MFEVVQEISFDAAHKLLGHEGKCQFLHGHTYTAKIILRQRSRGLNSLGMVIDFTEVKNLIKVWIDVNWDHNTILHNADPILDIPNCRAIFGAKQPYVMSLGNPTAELMAQQLWLASTDLLDMAGYEIDVMSVMIRETEKCYAIYHPNFFKEDVK